MSSRARPSRLLRIALSRPAGGRWHPALIQIALILAWHVLMIAGMSLIPFNRIEEWSSLFWYRTGFTSSFVSNIQYVSEQNEEWPDAFLLLASPVAIMVLLEALVGWIGYRLVIRRPRPRWYRFVRAWWRTCLYATLVIPAGAALLAMVPWPSAVEIPGPLALVVCFGVGPALLTRREIIRRARRLTLLCPVCRYCLRGVTANRCPECGTPLTPGRHGGYVLDQAEVRERRARRLRRWGRAAAVVALLIVGAIISHAGRALHRWYLDYRGSPGGITLRTARGSVEYQTCRLCGCARITLADGSQEYLVQTERCEDCPHDWQAGISASSAFQLSAGDVLLIRRGGHYHAVKILDPGRGGGSLRAEWYYQPNKNIGTFVDDGVERGEASAVGKVLFKDVDLPCQFGRIWYDYYYGGMSPANLNTADPHYVAYAGQVDIAQIDAADPRWIYKTWEDGKPNGFEKGTTRPDLRLSADDKRTLEFIWGRLAPRLQPRDDEELARFRVLLETNIADLRGVGGVKPIWPDVRDDFQAGGRPGGNPIWETLIGYRIAEVSTPGLGRIRGVVEPVFRTLGQEPFLVVQTDSDAVKVMLTDIALLRVGTPEVVQPSGPGTPMTSVPVRIRTRSGGVVEGVIASGDSMRLGLDFRLYPFRPLASAPAVFGGSIYLTVAADPQTGTLYQRYGWLSFADLAARVCPKCGLPAESTEWLVCPLDGTPYGP